MNWLLFISVQSYLNQLTYNHTGTQFFETRPNSSMITLMETARCMIREALPIKCMEGKTQLVSFDLTMVFVLTGTRGEPGMVVFYCKGLVYH